MIINILIILGLIISNVFARCSYTNIRKDIIDAGYNNVKNINNYTILEKTVYDLNNFNNIECNDGDFICQMDFYSAGNMRNYFYCNNAKWKLGKCGGLSLCHMDTNTEGCACW